MQTRALRTTLTLIATAVVFLALGLFLGGHPTDLPGALRNVFVDGAGSLRAELIHDVHNDYYKAVSVGALQDASLKGIVQSLHDPYSEYFTPAETKLFEQDVNGRFEGVGVEVQPQKGGLVIEKVLPGSPALGRGIHRGDEIVAVNGHSIANESSDVATARIKGPAGTRVTLGLRSRGATTTRSLTLLRAAIQVPVATARVVTSAGRKIGVVALSTFSSGAHGDVRQQVDRVLAGGARGIVLDLRGNGGGILDEGVLVASIFVDRGLIVSTRGRTQPQQRFDARGPAISAKIPMAVLVDGGTASAAEIVTGALRDHGRATVVGTKTYGKGVFQELQPLSNNATLKLTVGSYYLPDGENLAGHGIVPQLPARDNPRTARDEALAAALGAVVKRIR